VLETSEDDDDVEQTGFDEEEEVELEMGELDSEEEYIEEEIDDKDGSNKEIELLNEDDEDSSHRQFSVVVALAVEDKDE